MDTLAIFLVPSHWRKKIDKRGGYDGAWGLSGVGGLIPFWCGGLGFRPVVRDGEVNFFQDPYDFHMGPKRAK